jgi:radical SAM protein (TIGR01212 family)
MVSHISAPQSSNWRAAGLPFHALNFFYRNKFGCRVRKLSLDAGFGCPNRDGTLSATGCVFCDPASFSPGRRMFAQFPDIAGQIAEGIRRATPRPDDRFIAYLQPATNSYAPLDELSRLYLAAIDHPLIVGLVIGTRPDCLPDDVLDLLAEMARRTFLVVELGLQTIHDRTLELIGRGHDAAAFFDARRRCQSRGINVGVHVILGLPGESAAEMLQTAQALAPLGIHSVKPHNLYVVRDTPLALWLAEGHLRLLELEEYAARLVDFLEVLPAEVVVERLAGDAPREYLVAPRWCLDKQAVRRAVEAEFRRRDSRQGSKCRGE